jgi:uncharacterized cupredoxin-like copper-binding protein
MLCRIGLPLTAAILVAACGGDRNAATRAPAETTASETAGGAAAGGAQPAEAGKATMPAWMKVDEAAKTVSADIEAGKTPDNNHWNFNGYYNGNATITVPAGYKVRIQLKNSDPAVAHSIGVDSKMGDFPPMFQNPKPVFQGAISEDPTSPQGGTAPGKSATISFTADKPGQYSLVCYMPGHAATGMWMHFHVTEGGTPGVSTSS